MQHCVPVHTISFNCNDSEANRFLSDLARATGGRYHYFSEKGGMDLEGQPESWEVMTESCMVNCKSFFAILFSGLIMRTDLCLSSPTIVLS